MHSTTIQAARPTLPPSRGGRFVTNTRTACPCCGEVDPRGKCRFKPETGAVWCWRAPSVPLHGVETHADGVRRYLAQKDCGFSGMHAKWLPHTDLPRRRRGVAAPPEQTLSPDVAIAEGRKVCTAVNIVLRHPDFADCTTEQLRQHGRALEKVKERLTRLREMLRQVRKPSVGVDRLRVAVRFWEERIETHHAQLRAFQLFQLGEAVLAEVRS